MHHYRVTIPYIDAVDEPIEAESAARAALKLLNTQRVIELIETGDEIEAVVETDLGTKLVFNATANISFHLQRVG
jgi:hypothetical protein